MKFTLTEATARYQSVHYTFYQMVTKHPVDPDLWLDEGL